MPNFRKIKKEAVRFETVSKRTKKAIDNFALNIPFYETSSFTGQLLLRTIKKFKASKRNGYPATLKSMKEWNKILDDIIFFLKDLAGETSIFDFITDHGEYRFEKIEGSDLSRMVTVRKMKSDKRKEKAYIKRVEKGKQLFNEYIYCFWD